MNNSFIVELIARLNDANVAADFSKIEQSLKDRKIDINVAVDSATSKQEIKNLASNLQKVLSDAGLHIDTSKISSSIRELQKELQAVDPKKINDLANSMLTFRDNNTRMTSDMKNRLNDMYNNLVNGANLSEKELGELTQSFSKLKLEVRDAGLLGKSFGDKMKNAMSKFGEWGFATGIVTSFTSEIRESFGELKELDNILTEISKTSDMTASQLAKLGDTAFESASKYGRKASDYLTGVQEMSRSGFYGKQGEDMAEQSLLAQAAGDIDANVANKYVLATNAAYKFNGEAKKLNEVLDGQNMITNRNSVALEDMAVAMSEAGTTASSYRVSIEDLSAMIGTIESVTKLGGSEVGNAIKAILINLQNVTSDKIVDTLDAANASMTEMVNGAEKLRNPIDILRDLAKTFNDLEEDDPLRAEILTNIGQKYHATKLAALLQNMDMYDKMLGDYSEGEGSAWREAEKSVDNLTGRLSILSNTWTDTVENIVDSNALKTGVGVLNSLLSIVNKLTDALGSLGSIGLGAGLIAGIKNVGTANYISSPSKNYCFEIADSIVLRPMATIGIGSMPS